MDASNRKDVRAAEKAAKVTQAEQDYTLTNIMSTTAGRKWFHDLIASCRVFADPFSGDALVEAHSKGERNVGLRLFMDIMRACPDSYLLMMREENARQVIKEPTKPASAEEETDDE